MLEEDSLDELTLLDDFTLDEDRLEDELFTELDETLLLDLTDELLDELMLDELMLEDELFAELEDAGALSDMQRTGRYIWKVVKPSTYTLSPLTER